MMGTQTRWFQRLQESDIETDESDTESVQSIIRREEEDRAVPLVMEESRFGKSGHSGHVTFICSRCGQL